MLFGLCGISKVWNISLGLTTFGRKGKLLCESFHCWTLIFRSLHKWIKVLHFKIDRELVWKIASLRIIVTRKESHDWIEHSNLFQICWHWCELQAVPDNCDRLWCNHRRAALQVDHFPVYYFFLPNFAWANLGMGFSVFSLYPTMFVTVGGATNQWREGRGWLFRWTRRGEGEKGGGLLLNYSISGDHPGLILYRDDEDFKLPKKICSMVFVFHCVLCVFLGVLLGTVWNVWFNVILTPSKWISL